MIVSSFGRYLPRTAHDHESTPGRGWAGVPEARRVGWMGREVGQRGGFALGGLLGRYPYVQVVAEPRYRETFVLRGLTALEVRF